MKRKFIVFFTVAALALSLLTAPLLAANNKDSKSHSSATEVIKKAAKTGNEKVTSGTATDPQIKGGLMALTFDDGPSANTEKLLDAMKKRNIKLTFFVVGERLDEFSTLLKREYDEGHEIGSHTYNHMNLGKADSATITENLQKTQNKMEEILGASLGTILVRPPYGSVSDTAKSTINAPLILWSIDTLDWKSRNADAVKEQILNQACDGAIVLMHDLYDTSVDGCIAAVDELTKQGYTFVTVSELFRRKGETLAAGTTYTNAEKNGIDLGPLKEDTTKANNTTEKDNTKKENEKNKGKREDKGFPWGLLIFCSIVLVVYGAGMVTRFGFGTPSIPGKDISHEKAAPHATHRTTYRSDRNHRNNAPPSRRNNNRNR